MLLKIGAPNMTREEELQDVPEPPEPLRWMMMCRRDSPFRSKLKLQTARTRKEFYRYRPWGL